MNTAATIDDANLLRLYAAQGDAAAFAELVRRYADMVYATARRVTGNASIAEDVAQDCFLRLAQGSSAISGSLAAWLHRTSLNRSLELLRSERARHRREAQSAAASSIDPRPTEIEATELVSHVDEALAALPEELRIVVTEHFLCGKSQGDIAASLQLSQPTVSRRLEKGLSELRGWLKEHGWSTAVGGALPLVLANAGKVAAPSALRFSLIKIGLSGVGGAAVAKGPWLNRPPMLTAIAAVAVVMIGAATWLALSPPRPARVSLNPISAAAGRASPLPPAAAVNSTDGAEREDADAELQSIIPDIPVTDLAAAKTFYHRLGFESPESIADPNLLERDDLQLRLVVKTPPFDERASLRIGVKNAAALQAAVRKQGVTIAAPPGGLIDPQHFAVSDADGNRIVFFEQAKKDQH